MDEETKDQTTQQQEDQQTGEGEQNSAGRGMTFDEWLDSDPALRSEFARRNTKAVQTARSKWEKEQADNQDEAKKRERITGAQREKSQPEKDRQTLEQEWADTVTRKTRNPAGLGYCVIAAQTAAAPVGSAAKQEPGISVLADLLCTHYNIEAPGVKTPLRAAGVQCAKSAFEAKTVAALRLRGYPPDAAAGLIQRSL
ncbi:MAG: DUF4355 domain-containing protein [Oscillospiraceae bacterium]|nr:DUF4355 domain-containing protein [Oscillospiraceae bacterium]